MENNRIKSESKVNCSLLINAAFGALTMLTMTSVFADQRSGNNETNTEIGQNIIEICHLDEDGEYDLIRLSLDKGLDHFEIHLWDVIAVDGQCDAAE